MMSKREMPRYSWIVIFWVPLLIKQNNVGKASFLIPGSFSLAIVFSLSLSLSLSHFLAFGCQLLFDCCIVLIVGQNRRAIIWDWKWNCFLVSKQIKILQTKRFNVLQIMKRIVTISLYCDLWTCTIIRLYPTWTCMLNKFTWFYVKCKNMYRPEGFINRDY